MATSPIVVEFISDPRPTTVDHSKQSPGPHRTGADRAGYTSATLKPELLVDWQPAGSSREAYVQKAIIRFRLKDFVIMVSSNYARTSCAYTVTLKHEMMAHVDDPKRIFHLFKPIMESTVELIDLPTKKNPLRAKDRTELERAMDAAILPVREAIAEVQGLLRDRLRRASARHDSREEYKLVYGQCKASDWCVGDPSGPPSTGERDPRLVRFPASSPSRTVGR